MDDDDGYGSGMSGWAWHELGRGAERAHQARMDAAHALAARLRGERPVDVGALVAENQTLWQQNQALWQRIRDLEAEVQGRISDHRRLREWANIAEAELLGLRAEKRARETPQSD